MWFDSDRRCPGLWHRSCKTTGGFVNALWIPGYMGEPAMNRPRSEHDDGLRFIRIVSLLLLGALLVSSLRASETKAGPPLPTPKLEIVSAPGDIEQLRCAYSDGQLALLEKLNRCDWRKLAGMKEMVVPEHWDYDESVYSPLSEAPAWARELDKLLVVHQPSQAFAAYENGCLVRWGPVSTGAKRSPTPEGFFNLNWKSRERRSTVNRDWLLRWYYNFQNRSGRSFHEYELPGQPASHGCVRMLGRDAQWLYEWGENWRLDERGWNVEDPGTPVLILGQYNYGGPAPWRSEEFVAARSRLELSPDEFMLIAEVIEAHPEVETAPAIEQEPEASLAAAEPAWAVPAKD